MGIRFGGLQKAVKMLEGENFYFKKIHQNSSFFSFEHTGLSFQPVYDTSLLIYIKTITKTTVLAHESKSRVSQEFSS